MNRMYAPSLVCFIWRRISSFISRHSPPRVSFLTLSTSIDKALSVHPYTKIFACSDFSVHHKDWSTYSGVSDRHGELCCNFSVSQDLTQEAYPSLWLPYSHIWLWYLPSSTSWLLGGAPTSIGHYFCLSVRPSRTISQKLYIIRS